MSHAAPVPPQTPPGPAFAAGRPRVTPTGPTTGTVDFTPPLDLRGALAQLERHGDDLMDRWDGSVLRRTARLPGGGSVAWAARVSGGPEAPRLEVTVALPAHRDTALAGAAAALLDDAAPLRDLARRDPVIAAFVELHPALGQLLSPDLFAALVRAVSAQQVNLRWAATTRSRLAVAAGTRHEVAGGEVWSLEPERVAAMDPAELRALQFTTAKAVAIVGCAAAVAGGLTRDALEGLSDDDVVTRLIALRGIGRWTAEWVLARTLGRPVVVGGDLAVRKVIARAYLGVPIASEDEVRRCAAHWGAAAAAAQGLLLHALAAGDDLVAIGAAARGVAAS